MAEAGGTTGPGEQHREAFVVDQSGYRTLFDSCSEAVFVVDRKTGRYLDANLAAEALTGRSADELRTLTTRQVTPVGAEERLAFVAQSDGTLPIREVEYVRPDGTKRRAQLRAVPLNDDHVLGYAREVDQQETPPHELHQVLETLRESERRWRELFENMRDGWVSTDLVTI